MTAYVLACGSDVAAFKTSFEHLATWPARKAFRLGADVSTPREKDSGIGDAISTVAAFDLGGVIPGGGE